MLELEHLRHSWNKTIHGDGGKCPCCDRFGKVYSRTINETMAKSLEWLYKQNTTKGLREWIDVPNSAGKEILRTNQLSLLRWWDLVGRQTPSPTDKKHKGKHSGMWRITLKGMDFVEGKAVVPYKVHTYAGEVVGQTDDNLITFEACRGTRFDYQETMRQTNVEGAKALFPAVNVNHVSSVRMEHRGIFANAPV